MRFPRLAAAVVAAVLTGTITAAPARADDFYTDESFIVEQISASRSEVRVHGLQTTPVTITMTTRPLPGEYQHPGDGYMTLSEWVYPTMEGPLIPLKKVSTKGDLTTWKGVARITGPSRMLHFGAVHNCLSTNGNDGCPWSSYPHGFSPGLSIQVTATDTPVLSMDKRTRVGLSQRAYRVSGQVRTTSGAPLPRVRLLVARGKECGVPDAGVPTRTDARGRFSVLVTNRHRSAIGDAPPVMTEHCLRVTSSARDTGNRPVHLATLTTPHPWSTPIPLNAPARVRLGQEVAVWTRPTLLPLWTGLRLERLSGRTWHDAGFGQVGGSGRGVVTFVPVVAGTVTYRLRVADSDVTSANFVMTGVR
ncbi:hypothetical protein [Gephyromycinifex aptenodytis]|uniref:hypothetical protein n=1 Tax=Gephyromycinifex aptenodytis TaxID=2716227 RepID=UPI001444CFB1|nr:hypothetical protein [Gephyromycinifex aptenodytis]